MPKRTVTSQATPMRIVEDLWAARAAWVLVAGIDLQVFSHIGSGKRTAAELSRMAGASARPMARLLDALTGMGYLKKTSGRYALQPVAKTFLVESSPAYLGGMVEETRLTWDGWSGLTDAIRTGQPQVAVNDEAEARAFFPQLVRAIFPLSFATATAAAQAIPAAARRRVRDILDVAAGAAPWSIGMALAMLEARVTALDFEEVLAVADEYTERFGVRSRFDFLEGNLREVDFGRNAYDMLLLGHVIHSEGERWGKKLIRKSYRALRPGGLLLIAEMIPNDTRSGPAIPLIFGLNMLLHTAEGDVFTMKEYRSWLKGAGFGKVSTIDVPGPSPLILATK